MSTTTAEELLIASLTIRLPILFIEVASAQGCLAIATDKVFRVVGLIESLDDLTKDGFPAESTITTRRRTTMI